MRIVKVKLILIKGLSYAGYGVSVRIPKNPICTVEPGIALKLMETGRFKVIENICEPEEDEDENAEFFEKTGGEPENPETGKEEKPQELAQPAKPKGKRGKTQTAETENTIDYGESE